MIFFWCFLFFCQGLFALAPIPNSEIIPPPEKQEMLLQEKVSLQPKEKTSTEMAPIANKRVPLSYEVRFVGLHDLSTLKGLRAVSQLIALQNRPPLSLHALRFRAEADIPEMIKILHAHAYYDAKITINFEQVKKAILVFVTIISGPQYILKAYHVHPFPCPTPPLPAPCTLDAFLPESLGIFLGKAALTQDLINAELQILNHLDDMGYALASISQRDLLADPVKKEVKEDLYVNIGPLCHFGPITVAGIASIEPSFVVKKVAWEEGKAYNPFLIEKTRKRLLKTDLFSSVLITHGDQIDPVGDLPMKIYLTESKHKNVGLGISYATVDGFGGMFSWANRNLRGHGESLMTTLSLAQKTLLGIITYRKPDFLRVDQDYVAQWESEREKVPYVYLAFSHKISNRIDRKIGENILLAFGASGEYIDITQSIHEGKFFLLGLPFFLKHSTTDSTLNPTSGYSITLRITPYQNCAYSRISFLKQSLLGTIFLSADKAKKLIFAFRGQIGSILGPHTTSLPMNKLFFGGSDDDLRGYAYHTVSPLKDHHKPTGAKSAIFGTAEIRFLVNPKIGLVPFFDIGTLSKKGYPNPMGKWYKSIGLGVRYFSMIGPIRVDVGFPLDRRKIDHRYKLYVSIGQTF